MLHSQFSVLSFHPHNSLLLGLAHHLELPCGSFSRIEDVFFLQVHQIHLEIYLRRMTLAEIKGLIWAASVDRVIPPSSYSFINPELTDGFHLTILQTSIWKWLKGHIGAFLSLSLLSLFFHYVTEMNSADLQYFSPLSAPSRLTAPRKIHFVLYRSFPLKKCSDTWQIGKQWQK